MTTSSDSRDPSSSQDAPKSGVAQTLVKVLTIQVVTLLILWAMHARYTS